MGVKITGKGRLPEEQNVGAAESGGGIDGNIYRLVNLARGRNIGGV
jgi:hypothetical protein